jgi:hypothetical protein
LPTATPSSPIRVLTAGLTLEGESACVRIVPGARF